VHCRSGSLGISGTLPVIVDGEAIGLDLGTLSGLGKLCAMGQTVEQCGADFDFQVLDLLA